MGGSRESVAVRVGGGSSEVVAVAVPMGRCCRSVTIIVRRRGSCCHTILVTMGTDGVSETIGIS